MIEVEFPTHRFKIKNDDGRETIFDAYRKRWVLLTPEEWVRQNFLQYLVSIKKYPAALIAVEREIILGDLKKRFDIVVYKNSQPWMIVECKEMNVQVGEHVLRQVLNYNIALQVQYIVVTNGKSTFAMHVNGGLHEWLTEMPNY